MASDLDIPSTYIGEPETHDHSDDEEGGDSISPTSALVGGRPVRSGQRRSVSVPGDYDTIQAAIDNEWSMFAEHELFIDVSSSYTSSEDVHITGIVGGGEDDKGNDQSLPKIYGGTDTNGNPTSAVNSITISGTLAHNGPKIQDMKVTGFSPWSPRPASIVGFGCRTPAFRNVAITADGSNKTRPYAVYAYHSEMEVVGVDVSGAASLQAGAYSKGTDSTLLIQDASGGGTALTNGYEVEDGDIIVGGTLFGYSSSFRNRYGTGHIIDRSSNGNKYLTDLHLGPYEGFTSNSNQAVFENASHKWAVRADDSTLAVRHNGGSGYSFHGRIVAGGGHTFSGSPANLSGTAGTFDGEERIDDGTNTSRRGTKCIWDGVNNQWVPQDGSTTFT